MPPRAVVIALLLGFAALAAQPAVAEEDPASVFRVQCGLCHEISPDGPRRIGPPLAGIYGRKAGTVPGFKYSNALAHADFVWDDAKLDAWLTRPQSVVPATTMVYRVPNPVTRQALVAWLKEQR